MNRGREAGRGAGWVARSLIIVVAAVLPSTLGAAAATGPPATLLGAYYGNQGWAMTDVKALEAWQGKRHAVVELFTNWNGSRKTVDNLFKQQLPNIWANGNVPLITWEPFTGHTTPADIEVRIAAGAYDTYVATWGQRLRNFLAGGDGQVGTADDRRAFVRLGHEANGNWYPWGAAVGANTPSDYVGMWQRVHGIVSQGLGPSHLQWIWAVNGEDVGGHRAEAFYPGDGFVDWLAVDGYNWGASQSWSSWQSPEQVLGPMVTRLRTQVNATKPLAITETASTSATSSGPQPEMKSQWVRDLFAWLPTRDVRMLVWFNADKETDWAVFGGSGGDTTYRYSRTTYRGFTAYRDAAGSEAMAGSQLGNPRLLTDDQFAGR